MTGYEVCRRLRQNHSLNDLPVVFLTAKNQESDMLEALQAGGNDFISKPFRKAEVLARVGLHSRLASYARMTGRFVPWRGLEWLGYKSILDVRLGDAVDLDLTVMFTDLRDFTSITADMAPREIMRMINSYIRATAPVVARHGGLIDKYIGDGMMAIFRSPADAIRAAIKLIETVNEYNSANRSGGRRPGLTCRVALNSGGVTYGPMGYEERIELTPLSNVVNVASRLDGLAKVFGATLVAAEHMLASAPTDLPFRRLGSVSIRGRQEKLRLVEILAGETSDSLRRKIESRAEFEGNVELLESGQVSRALDGFLILARRDPGDQAVRYFLDQCRSQLASLVNTVDAAA
jgi:two-component system sensor histidine kinase ChiS